MNCRRAQWFLGVVFFAIGAPFLFLLLLLSLGDPVNANPDPPMATDLLIVDNEDLPCVKFKNASWFMIVFENAGFAEIGVDLCATSENLVGVDLEIGAGTAEEDLDYTNTNSTLTFTPGQTEAYVDLPIINDAEDEYVETVYLTLTNPTNAVLGSPMTMTLMIVDDDPPVDTTFFFPVAFRNFVPAESNDECASAFPLLPNVGYWFLPDDPIDCYRFDTYSAADIVIELTNFVPGAGAIVVYYSEDATYATGYLVDRYIISGTTSILEMGRRPAGRYYLLIVNDGPLSDTENYRLIVHVEN